MSKWRDLYNRTPRAGRWALWAGAFVAGYFAVIEPVMGLGARVGAQTDELRADLDARLNELERRDDVLLGIRERTAWFGDLRVPGGSGAMQSALRDRIDAVFKDLGVPSGWSWDRRSEGRVSRDAMPDALAADEELMRLEIELKFECDPKTAIEVIAALERSPEVAGVPRVVLRRATDGRKVQATVAVEAWSIEKKPIETGAGA